jgi:hypothetical protein
MIRAGRRVIAQRDSRWLHEWNVLEEEMKFMSKTSALVFAGVTLGAMCTFGASAFPAASVDAKSPATSFWRPKDAGGASIASTDAASQTGRRTGSVLLAGTSPSRAIAACADRYAGRFRR